MRESLYLEIVDEAKAKSEAKVEVTVTNGKLDLPVPGRSDHLSPRAHTKRGTMTSPTGSMTSPTDSMTSPTGYMTSPIDCEEYEPPSPDVIIMIEPLDTETRPESDTGLAPPTGVNPSLTSFDLQSALPNVMPSGGRKTQQKVAPSGGNTKLPNLKLDAEKYKTLRALILQAVRVCMSQGEGLSLTGKEQDPSPRGIGDQSASQGKTRCRPTLRELISGRQCSVRTGGRRRRGKLDAGPGRLDAGSESDDEGDGGRINVHNTDTDADD